MGQGGSSWSSSLAAVIEKHRAAAGAEAELRATAESVAGRAALRHRAIEAMAEEERGGGGEVVVVKAGWLLDGEEEGCCELAESSKLHKR